ncbi:MAG: type 1 fimbrial protein [Rhodanobacteraceae bacterium]|nr:MAG: type 1 fimbrial protein [Rhodanobacteraceae bacterium]
MNLKPTLLAVGLAVACGGLAIAPAALAADGTINITGKVLNGTCNVSVNGGASVVLPDVQASALTAGSADNADAQGFTVGLNGCPSSPSGVRVGLTFTSTNADTGTGSGTLNNTGVTDLDVQLMHTSDGVTAPALTTSGGTPVALDGSTVTGAVTLTSAGTANFNFYAQYYPLSTWTSADTGAVSTSAEFNVNYQ